MVEEQNVEKTIDAEEEKHNKRLKEIDEATKRLELANKEFKINVERLEAEKHLQMMGGKSEKKKAEREETPQEYAKRVMRGDI